MPEQSDAAEAPVAGETIAPRFEFRAMSGALAPVEARVRAASPCREVTESFETYLVPPGALDRNVKIRGDRLEIKRRIETRGPLERWRPAGRASFPVSREFVRTELIPALDIDRLPVDRASYSPDELVRALGRPSLELIVTGVFKRRFRFEVGGCPTEIDELLIGGTPMRSVAVESEDADAVLAVLEQLGLEAYENVSYPRAIRRIAEGEASALEPA